MENRDNRTTGRTSILESHAVSLFMFWYCIVGTLQALAVLGYGIAVNRVPSIVTGTICAMIQIWLAVDCWRKLSK